MAFTFSANSLPPLRDLNKILYLSDTSPSWLRWKITTSTRARKDSVAGHLHPSGYWRVAIKGKLYAAHRIIMYMHTEADYPGLEVDRINNIKSDNNPENLRWANRSQNSKNRPPAHVRKNRSLSQTGYRCVYPIKKSKGFTAVTPGPNGQKYLGYYKNAREAFDAVQAWRSSQGLSTYPDPDLPPPNLTPGPW